MTKLIEMIKRSIITVGLAKGICHINCTHLRDKTVDETNRDNTLIIRIVDFSFTLKKTKEKNACP